MTTSFASAFILSNEFEQKEKLFGLLKNEFKFSGQLEHEKDFEKAKEMIRDTRPEIIFLESMQDRDEDTVKIKGILAQDPWANIILLIEKGMRRHGLNAIKAGACSYLFQNNITFKSLEDAMDVAFERTKAKREVIALSKYGAIGSVASGIAHNINNKLTLMSLLLLDGKSRTNDPQILEVFERIEGIKDSCASMNREVLSYSHRTSPKEEIFGLSTLLRRNLALIKRVLDEKVCLKTSLEQEVKVKMSPVHFDQVIFNLVMNGKQALGQGGALEISISSVFNKCQRTFKKKEFGCLEVKDNGVGMDSDAKTKIFNPFFTTKKNGEGHGLGLSTVYEIIRGYDGMIEVESELGLGTVFKVFIPAMETSPRVSPAEK